MQERQHNTVFSKNEETALTVILNDLITGFTKDKVYAALRLMGIGMKADTVNKDGDTLLHILVKQQEWNLPGHWITDAIKELITRHKLEPDVKNVSGLTSLQCLMSKAGYYFFKIDVLISLKANPNTLDYQGSSIMHNLAEGNRYNELRLSFLKNAVLNGADINLKNRNNFSPLEMLINQQGGFSTECVMILVELGANPNVKLGNKALLQVLIDNATKDRLGNKDAVRDLITKYNADIHQLDANGNSVLHSILMNEYYCQAEGFSMVKELLKRGIDCVNGNHQGQTPMYLAALMSGKVNNYDYCSLIKEYVDKQRQESKILALNIFFNDSQMLYPKEVILNIVSNFGSNNFLFSLCASFSNSFTNVSNTLFLIRAQCALEKYNSEWNYYRSNDSTLFFKSMCSTLNYAYKNKKEKVADISERIFNLREEKDKNQTASKSSAIRVLSHFHILNVRRPSVEAAVERQDEKNNASPGK
jgi:ankyrin repeat protein